MAFELEGELKSLGKDVSVSDMAIYDPEVCVKKKRIGGAKRHTEKNRSKASASKANYSTRHNTKSPNNFALSSLLKKIA